MTCTVTITEPGAAPVTVSLEWTADEPTEPGLYFYEYFTNSSARYVDSVKIIGFGGRDIRVDHYEDDKQESVGSFARGRKFFRWLGPLPLPPSGA